MPLNPPVAQTNVLLDLPLGFQQPDSIRKDVKHTSGERCIDLPLCLAECVVLLTLVEPPSNFFKAFNGASIPRYCFQHLNPWPGAILAFEVSMFLLAHQHQPKLTVLLVRLNETVLLPHPNQIPRSGQCQEIFWSPEVPIEQYKMVSS